MNKKNFFKNRKSFQKTHTEIRYHIFKTTSCLRETLKRDFEGPVLMFFNSEYIPSVISHIFVQVFD